MTHSPATTTATGYVTEREWTPAPTKARPNPHPVVARLGHLDPACTAAHGATIVADGLTFDQVLNEWTCGQCVPVNLLPNAKGAPAPTAAEIAERVAEHQHGTGCGHGHHSAPEGPTAKQEAFLRTLWTRHGIDATTAEAEMVAAGTWTRKGASATIDRLLDTAHPTPAAPAATPSALPAGVEILTRTNRYGGACVLCGGHVADEAGRLAKRAGKWAVAHNDGECSATPAAAPVEAPLADVPAGHYAIPSTGDNDLAFYRVDRPEDGPYAGRVFVKIVIGGHPDQNLGRQQVGRVLARIAEYGPAEAGALYGQEIGRCYRCNRTLTDEESRRLGIGPECRKKG